MGEFLLKRQNTFEFFDELNRKLLKQDTLTGIPANLSSNSAPPVMSHVFPKVDMSMKLPDLTNCLTGLFNKQSDLPEDPPSFALPILSKKSSVISQQAPDELPSLSRFNSSCSFLLEKSWKASSF